MLITTKRQSYFLVLSVTTIGALAKTAALMIHITRAHIEKYRGLYFLEHGIVIDAEQARLEFTALVNLVATVHNHLEKHDWPNLEQ